MNPTLVSDDGDQPAHVKIGTCVVKPLFLADGEKSPLLGYDSSPPKLDL